MRALPWSLAAVGTWSVRVLSPRSTVIDTASPGFFAWIAALTASGVVAGVPSTDLITSPALSVPSAGAPSWMAFTTMSRWMGMPSWVQGGGRGRALRELHVLGVALLDLLGRGVVGELDPRRHHGVCAGRTRHAAP